MKTLDELFAERDALQAENAKLKTQIAALESVKAENANLKVSAKVSAIREEMLAKKTNGKATLVLGNKEGTLTARVLAAKGVSDLDELVANRGTRGKAK